MIITPNGPWNDPGAPAARGLRTKGLPACLVVAALAMIAGAAEAAQPDPEGVAFFEKNVRPLLVEHCYSCHSAEGKRIKGNLRLDDSAAWLVGGDLGPAVVPGDPAESLLITAVGYKDESLLMPPKGKLDDRQIDVLTRWVEMGAPAPESIAATASKPEAATDPGQGAWAFRPPADPTPPAVSASDPASTPPGDDLDRFILAQLEAQGLKPAPPADKPTLIRRATFDLTGLPPTPEEIDAFLADDAPDAFERVVERLLASPHYGERWGRHWLDVARYADSNGLDENVAHGNAWRYRDYVVAAFNRDKPYDQFIVEQLAGDLLPKTDPVEVQHERLIATGFLTLGPKVLAEVDKTKMEMDIIDEQIDTLGRAVLGLTLGCARCHDHKFDPITAADYYALAGVFKSTKTMESFATVARWHENTIATEPDLARKAAHDAEVAAARAEIDRLVAAADEQVRAGKAEGATLPEKLEPLYPEETRARIVKLRADLAALEKAAPVMPSAMGVAEGTPTDVAVHIRGSHLALGAVVPRRAPQVFNEASPTSFGGTQSGRLELARWLVEPDHPLTARVMVNRIWRWHFGRGLVSTTDNFGVNGALPTHPELLDWLARRFVDGRWSIKAMHRLIMLSATYQMSSDADPQALQKDPEDRLYWRWDVRRLEAEEIRDALLAVSGALDETMGGSLLQVENRAYFFDHTSRDKTGYDTRRRSLYLPIVRNHLYDMFQLFDSTDANVMNGDRATTTVAPQALFMMNSDLVIQSARELAADLLARPESDDADRLRRLYQRTYGRTPTTDESRRDLAFLDRFERLPHDGPGGSGGSKGEPSRPEAWQALCQVILASNEFVYIR
ncbi:PSD1 and planctomycete cytochrome C domain-containing protein [Planctomyces sp. SH-PL62]|uniref:PSD1 and planctomycete cytochrome C domain-containing protein n=1 Tax=Planctomyces sp. SH-PL62 TaxID=1636152 RepID=UPI00078B5175|nr:PSD1 and planctomycete cytochrome C domain-containing protein [Planctomyces sp. SH-PL62]AMV40032.1 Planctomycete cytochrome C [Planctomyces sp. SH-PL62]